jgi:hypothetical protein
VYAAYEVGVRSFESSFGELGGCPVPKGATGNVATEDVVSMLHEMGASTGADLRRLVSRRRLRHSAGTLAILNLFLIGVWIASGSSYFWPVWVMLGSALALAIKALPRPHRGHRELLDELG